MGDQVDIHAIAVTIGLEPGIGAGDGAVVDHGAITVRAEARTVAPGDVAIVDQCCAQVGGDAVAPAREGAVVGHRHAGCRVDVDTVELVVVVQGVACGNLAVVENRGVGAGLHTVAELAANQPALTVDQSGPHVFTAHGIEVDGLAAAG